MTIVLAPAISGQNAEACGCFFASELKVKSIRIGQIGMTGRIGDPELLDGGLAGDVLDNRVDRVRGHAILFRRGDKLRCQHGLADHVAGNRVFAAGRPRRRSAGGQCEIDANNRSEQSRFQHRAHLLQGSAIAVIRCQIRPMPNPTPPYHCEEANFSSLSALRMPANDGIRHRVGRRKIRLDVEKRRFVEAVNPDHIKRIALDADKTRHRNRNRIRPCRRA